MSDDYLYIKRQIAKISLSMFRKNFFGMFHGSISAKVEHNKFIINKKDAIFDEIDEESLVTLYYNRDYRWKTASMDSLIHANIYKNISDAKYVAFGMPPYAISCSLERSLIIPKDYFGFKAFGKIEVYDPKSFDDWYERVDVEIYRHMKDRGSRIVLIRGYGVYVYDRDINSLIKNMAILEKSCHIFYLSEAMSN